MPDQAKTWDELLVWVKETKKRLKALPAPPVPRDTWSEKVNAMNKTVQGMEEQLASEIESEDLRKEQEAALAASDE